MRLPPRTHAWLLACCISLTLAVGAPAAGAAQTLALVDPVTDNYKASYNADPATPELRTWLAMRALSAASTTWAPAPPGAIQFVDATSVPLVSADGRQGQLVARVTSGPIVAPLRVRIDPLHVESQGRWGLFAAISSRDALRVQAATISLQLVVGGAIMADGIVQLRHDAALASVPANHIEFNGPAARWRVGSTDTRMNWEPAPAGGAQVISAGSTTAASPVYRRARITRIIAPARTKRRVVSVRVRGRAGTRRITHVRFAIGTGRFTKWHRTRRGYQVVLPRANRRWTLRVQLRDAAGKSSAVRSRAIRCSCR